MAQQLVLLVEVAAEHLRGLVHGVLNLDGNTTTSLALLDDLKDSLACDTHIVNDQ